MPQQKRKKKNLSLSPSQALAAFLAISFLVGALSSFAVNKFFQSGLRREILEQETVPAPRQFRSPPVSSSGEADLEREPLLATLVTIYQKKESPLFLENVYLPKDLRGGGFILTSDGWLLTSAEIFARQSAESLVVEKDRLIYEIEKKIIDPVSGIAFIKINAVNLPVSRLADSGFLDSGDTVFLAGRDKKLLVNFIADSGYLPLRDKSDLILSSERFTHLVSAQNSPSQGGLAGAPVFNKRGEVVGLQTLAEPDELLFIPLDYFNGILSEVLKDEQISRPFLGVRYLDLSEIVGFKDGAEGYQLGELILNEVKGALVYERIKSLAVSEDSPADEAGLQYGDLIIKVDDLLIDSQNKLNRLIQEYGPGDSLRLVVRREGKEISLNVKLAEMEQSD